jgi:hypothetical protein
MLSWYLLTSVLFHWAPGFPDEGFVRVEEADAYQINTQGVMVCSSCTTGYLNIMSRQHCHASVRHKHHDFFTQLHSMRTKHGSDGAWQKFAETSMTWRVAGETRIDWEIDN